MRRNHEIDYDIIGEEMQYVEIELDPNETAIAESGSFMMMDDGLQMATILGNTNACTWTSPIRCMQLFIYSQNPV